MQQPDDIENLISAWSKAPQHKRRVARLQNFHYVVRANITAFFRLTIAKFSRRVPALDGHVQTLPDGPFPELAARSLVLIISVCVAWVTAWSLYFDSQGWQQAPTMIPLFIAWVFVVLFYRGVKLRMNGQVAG
jgi:hypothetical protein